MQTIYATFYASEKLSYVEHLFSTHFIAEIISSVILSNLDLFYIYILDIFIFYL